jgi:hypothetical protein
VNFMSQNRGIIKFVNIVVIWRNSFQATRACHSEKEYCKVIIVARSIK